MDSIFTYNFTTFIQMECIIVMRISILLATTAPLDAQAV